MPGSLEKVWFRIAVIPEFVNWLLYYGSRVEVLEPASLRWHAPERSCRKDTNP